MSRKVSLQGRAGAALIVLLASTASTAAAQTNSSSGTWSMTFPNLQNKGTVVLADLPSPATYQICRNRLNGAGSKELYVYVDDRPLRSNGVSVAAPSRAATSSAPFNNYSLDEGSCLIVSGQKLALRYSGSVIDVNASVNGRFSRLSPDLTPITAPIISAWSMAFGGQGGAQFHDVVLVENVPGTYRVCITNAEVQPTTGYTNLGIEVDGALVRFGAEPVPARFGTCTDVKGSRIVMRQLSWSTGLNYYIVTGSLSLLNPG